MTSVVEEKKKLLTAEQILAADDISFIEMDIPQWGGTVRFRALSAAEAIKFGNPDEGDEVAKQTSIIRIFALSAVDEDGNRLFTEAEIRLLMKKNWAVFTRVQDRLMDFNGMRNSARALATLKKD